MKPTRKRDKAKRKPTPEETANRIEDRKCSGKGRSHGIRSSVAKTWDSSKGKRVSVKTVKAKDLDDDRLDAIAAKLAAATGWSVSWIRGRDPKQIYGMARKYL